jgi:FixJ family two-component response regulator
MFLTAHASKNTLLSAIRLGVVHVLEKPVQEDYLVATVALVLEREKRKIDLTKQKVMQGTPIEELTRKEKILGLLHVTNERKKVR